jgi:aldose 1-epimerase
MPTPPAITDQPFGTMPDGTEVRAFTLATPDGVRMRVLTYGAIIASFAVPDRHGEPGDVVLGHDDLEGYLRASPYFGAVIGRCANRIARGRFTLEGVEHVLATNNGVNHLHGGEQGFDRRVWSAVPGGDAARPSLVLALTSDDGDEGYPGRVAAQVTYTLSDRDGLEIDYLARTDRATPVSLTQHSYWNLAGAGAATVLDHELEVRAERFTPVDAGLIPTGELRPVQGTPFDFRTPATVGARVDSADEQLLRAGGYDHNFVLGPPEADGLRTAAVLRERASGRALEVRTSEPGLQLYSGNFLDGSIRGKGGRVYAHRSALCLETQHFPDSPNQPGFPSVILRPGQEYRSRTTYRFFTDPGAG